MVHKAQSGDEGTSTGLHLCVLKYKLLSIRTLKNKNNSRVAGHIQKGNTDL